MPKSGLDNAPSRITVRTVKTTRAILLSLLVVWVQMVTAVEPGSSRAQNEACACPSSCKTRCCVSRSSSPAPAPAPAAPLRAGAQSELSIPPSVSAVWVLPDSGTASISSFCASPLIAAGAPLYERNCALLL